MESIEVNGTKGQRQMREQRNLKIINIRALAIVIVVLGHSIILFDPAWGIYQPSHSSAVLMYVKRYISLVQMPLFFSLSGACYGLSVWWKKYSFRSFVRKKVRRLLLPFVAVSLLWMIPIRLLSRYPYWEQLSMRDILAQVFLGRDAGHLWYLGCLFLIFLAVGAVTPAAVRVWKGRGGIWAAACGALLLLGLSVASPLFPSVLFLSSCAKYLFWFYAGLCLWPVCEKQPARRGAAGAVATACLLTLSVFGRLRPGLPGIGIEYAGVGCFLFTVFTWTPSRTSPAIEKLAADSYGVYLFHSPLLYPVFCYFSWLPPLVIVSFNFAVCGAVVLQLTALCRKTLVTRRMIGEM